MHSFFSISRPIISNNSSRESLIPSSPRASPLTLSLIQPDNNTDNINNNTNNNDAERLLNEDSISIIELIETNINLPSFGLTDSEKTWIKLLITNSPTSFEPIDSFLNTFLSTESLNVENIPALVELFANVFNNVSIELNIANSHNVHATIKFIIDVLIDVIPLPYMEISVIKSITNSSLSLLSTVLAESSSNIPCVETATTTTISQEAEVESIGEAEDVSANVIPPQKVEPEVSVIQDTSNNEIRPVEPITTFEQTTLPEVTTNKCCVTLRFW